MGSQSAAAFAELVNDGAASLRTAVSWHLTSNHYPPHPTFMVPVCVAAIEAAKADEWDTPIALPLGCVEHRVVIEPWNETEHATCELDNVVEWQGGDRLPTAGEVVHSFHLETFI